MCGIAGIVSRGDLTRVVDTVIERLEHRGPDDRGTYRTENAAFAHARLSIIDVEGGKQPIFNEDRSVCIVFNGEIYNHRTLRESLVCPHEFATDTEVIVHLYEEMGEHCVQLLDGMFALAIYDEERGLLLARDPLGIKPLYVSRAGDDLFFASEMKGLLGVVSQFEEFPAGHTYQSETGLNTSFVMPRPHAATMTAEQARDGILQYLEKAVEKRLMSDVPLGIFLSGGLDSSIIAAIAARGVTNLSTFSVGMADSTDREFAHLASRHLGTKHHEHIYDLDNMLKALPSVIYYLESYDASLVRSAIPNYFLARLASEHVKVVLSGEGADEIFSGYHYLKDLKRNELHGELVEITEGLHNTNLQRCDRMTMAHGIEGRVPFLDIDLVRFAFSIPIDLKLGPNDTEKWILREAFRGCLPNEIIDRRKSKFSEGAGSMDALAEVAENDISDADFEKSAQLPNGRVVRNKEELMYYRIFRKFYPADAAIESVGTSRSLGA